MTSEDIKHQLIIITVAYAFSGVVVSEASRFVALCRRPCRIGIADRDKLMVSYILPIFFLTNDFCIVFSGGSRYPESILH